MTLGGTGDGGIREEKGNTVQKNRSGYRPGLRVVTGLPLTQKWHYLPQGLFGSLHIFSCLSYQDTEFYSFPHIHSILDTEFKILLTNSYIYPQAFSPAPRRLQTQIQKKPHLCFKLKFVLKKIELVKASKNNLIFWPLSSFLKSHQCKT